jgi:imidazolonepropionase-like amidohydrolase
MANIIERLMNKPRGRVGRGAIAALALCLLAFTARAEPVADVLYENATVIDGTGAPAQSGRDILVHGERIVAISAHGAGASAPDGLRRVDLSGRFVLPGLVDSHVHLATPPDRVRAEARLKRSLYGGVTAVRDMADDLRAVAELARSSRAQEIPAPDIYYAAVMAGPAFFLDPRVAQVSLGVTPGAAPWMQAIDEKTDLKMAVALARGTSATAIKIYADLAPERVAAITAEAHRQGLLVWAHSAVFPSRPAEVLAAGPDAVSHVCYLAYQLEPQRLAAYEDHTPVNEALMASEDNPVMGELFATMRRQGVILDATGDLFVQKGPAYAAAGHPLRCSGEATIRLTRQAFRSGVAISAGTDFEHEAGSPWPEVHDEIYFLVRNVGMTPLQAIHSATQVGAEAAGQGRDMGTLKPGKLANLVVLAGDPLADIGALQSIVLTVKRGREYPREAFSPPVAENAHVH